MEQSTGQGIICNIIVSFSTLPLLARYSFFEAQFTFCKTRAKYQWDIYQYPPLTMTTLLHILHLQGVSSIYKELVQLCMYTQYVINSIQCYTCDPKQWHWIVPFRRADRIRDKLVVSVCNTPFYQYDNLFLVISK